MVIKKNGKIKRHAFTVQNGRNQYHLIPYVGNKSGFSHIFDALIPNLTFKRKIYDVFGGSASFSIYASYRFGSKNVIYNDNNPTIVNFIRWVKTNPKDLVREYFKHKKKSSEQHYLDVRQMNLDDDLISAGRFLYLAKNAFSGKIRFNSSNKFNSPMRKMSKCPNLKLEHMLDISKTIKDITITNQSYGYFEDVSKGFIYLDPPYLNNPNNHYTKVPKTDEFIKFVKKIEKKNMVMISEQNKPQDLSLSKKYTVFDIFLKRSLQYLTQNNSKEIIAINYASPQRITKW